VDGRSPSIWDVYVKADRSRVRDKSTADVACDTYKRYANDSALMNSLGIKNYRCGAAVPARKPLQRAGASCRPTLDGRADSAMADAGGDAAAGMTLLSCGAILLRLSGLPPPLCPRGRPSCASPKGSRSAGAA
jgi:hypothetical protein